MTRTHAIALPALLLLLAAPAAAAGGEEGGGADGEDYTTVVTAAKPAAKDKTQDAVAVDGGKVRDSARGSTLEALSQASASVYVTGKGALHGVASGATGAITIRGLGGSPNTQVLVVEDGVPDSQGIFGHPIPDAYVPALLGEALVLKGGDSVLFGTNAMGGVVLLRSRWLEGEGFELHHDVALGSFSTVRESAALLGRFGGWDVAAAFVGLSTDGHRQGAGGGELVAQTAARRCLAPGVCLALRNKVVHLEGSDPGTVRHPLDGRWYDVWRDVTSLQLTVESGPLALTLTPYVNAGVHRLYDGFRSVDWVYGAVAQADLSLHPRAALLLGAAVELAGGDIENRVTGERPAVTGTAEAAFFSQLTLRPVDSLVLVAGTREVESSPYGFALLYKAGAKWSIWRGLFARARVARSYRRPTIRELYLPYPVANPSLRPETALTLDAGIGFESAHLSVACTVYRTEADDMIKYFGAWPAAEVVNVDHVVTWGVEGRVALERLGPVSLSVTADWRDVGRHTRQNPEAKLDFEVAAAHAFGPHFVGGSLAGEWVHGLYMANYKRQPMRDVFAMDLSLRYRYTWPGRGVAVEPYLFLRNLLDRRVEYVEGYPMPGVNLLAGLKVEI